MNECVKEVLKSIIGFYSEEKYDDLIEMIIMANQAKEITDEVQLYLIEVLKHWKFYRELVG